MDPNQWIALEGKLEGSGVEWSGVEGRAREGKGKGKGKRKKEIDTLSVTLICQRDYGPKSVDLKVNRERERREERSYLIY
jgi:hypothetical protein